MPTTEDRLTQLRLRESEFTGIDFVQVVDKCDQTRLRVYFLTDTLDLRPPFEEVVPPTPPLPLQPRDFHIYSPRGEAPDVPVIDCPDLAGGMQWAEDTAACRRYLEFCVAHPGEFTDYRLRIDDPRIDRVFNDVPFSFKVGCDATLDCASQSDECPEDSLIDFEVDYLARDFSIPFQGFQR